MKNLDIEKSSSENIEVADVKEMLDTDVDHSLEARMPASLASLSEGELAAINKKATRKIDILLMPTLIFLYVLNFLDRNNISTAKIGGITKTLNMPHSNQFSTAVAILFAGYIAFQIPSNIIAARVPRPGVYICIMCALWGMVSACTAAATSYNGLLVCRLVLGFTEAAFFPGAFFLLTLFYTKQQIALRTGILYSGSQMGNAVGGLFALGCLELDGVHGIIGWRWLFIIEGAMTVGCALIFMTYIPNRPESYRWLTDVEREAVMYRLACDRQTKDYSDQVTTAHAFKLAVTDPKVWFVAIALTVNFVASAVTNFFPIVVAQLGFSRKVSLALTAPPYLLCVIVISIMGWHSDKVQERTIHIVCAFTVTIIANVLAVATTKTAPSFYSSSIIILSWMSSTIVGPHVKRAIAIAIINSVSNSSNIWTSYLYFNAPRYLVAFIVNLVASVLLICIVVAKRFYLASLNKKLDRGEDLGPNGPTKTQIEAGFRFQL